MGIKLWQEPKTEAGRSPGKQAGAQGGRQEHKKAGWGRPDHAVKVWKMMGNANKSHMNSACLRPILAAMKYIFGRLNALLAAIKYGVLLSWRRLNTIPRRLNAPCVVGDYMRFWVCPGD